MDTKALAKSKRAQSLHHNKKHHRHQTSKAPSVSSGTASGGKKQPGKQVSEKPPQSQNSRKLPSNWDWYEEEFVADSEDTAQGSSSQETDVVRKSKGADYACLLSVQRPRLSLKEIILLITFHHLLMSLMGLGPLLSARGQGIMLWIADDNFKVEDKLTTSYEIDELQESSEDEQYFGQISYGTHDVETNNGVSSLS